MAVATRSTVNTDAVKEAGGGPLIDPATFEEIMSHPDLQRAVRALADIHRTHREEMTRFGDELQPISVQRAETFGRLLYFAANVSPWNLEQVVNAAEAWYMHHQMQSSCVPMVDGRFEWDPSLNEEVQLIGRVIAGLALYPDEDFQRPDGKGA